MALESTLELSRAVVCSCVASLGEALLYAAAATVCGVRLAQPKAVLLDAPDCRWQQLQPQPSSHCQGLDTHSSMSVSRSLSASSLVFCVLPSLQVFVAEPLQHWLQCSLNTIRKRILVWWRGLTVCQGLVVLAPRLSYIRGLPVVWGYCQCTSCGGGWIPLLSSFLENHGCCS